MDSSEMESTDDWRACMRTCLDCSEDESQISSSTEELREGQCEKSHRVKRTLVYRDREAPKRDPSGFHVLVQDSLPCALPRESV